MRKTFATRRAPRVSGRWATWRGPRGSLRPNRPVSTHARLRDWIILAVAVVLATPGVPRSGAAAASPTPLLDGDWYVLVHYRDARADDPDALFWDDEIWRFARRGDGRLVWTLHPHVGLRDATGRFDRLPSGAEARTSGAWTPNEAQREEIETALVLDDHEVRTKRLQGSPADGYRSRGAMRPASASAVAYQEAWSVEAPAGLPELTRRATLVSGRADAAEGLTSFRTTAVSDDRAELRGAFVRDGHLVGEFRATRIRVAEGRRP